MRGLTNAPKQVDDVDTHAATHYAGGSDPIDLAKLGAISASEKGKAGGVATLGEDGKVPSEQLPAMNYAAENHGHDGVYAPAYTYGTTDLTAGTSELATGKLHFVYE